MVLLPDSKICPQCKSTDVNRIRRNFLIRVIPGSKQYLCNACNQRFTLLFNLFAFKKSSIAFYTAVGGLIGLVLVLILALFVLTNTREKTAENRITHPTVNNLPATLSKRSQEEIKRQAKNHPASSLADALEDQLNHKVETSLTKDVSTSPDGLSSTQTQESEKSLAAKSRTLLDSLCPEVSPKSPCMVRTIQVAIGNLRAEPTTQSRIKGMVKKGDNVSIITEKDWYFVKLEDGRTGWCHKKLFLEKSGFLRSAGSILKKTENESLFREDSLQASRENDNMVKLKVSVGRFRESPSLKSRIKFRLKRGNTVSIIRTEKDWYFVKLEDGRTAWCHKSLFF